MGAKLYLQNRKAKKQKDIVKRAWDSFEHIEGVHTLNLFLANIYVYDDADFANHVEEALSMCVKPEDIVGYLNLQNYLIPDTIYYLKLAEFEVYKEYYQKSDIWYMVKHILEKTGISEVSIEELQEYKEKQLQSIRKVNPEIEKTKTMVYPSAYSEEQVA